MTKTYLFHYHYEGATYGFDIPADSPEEAEARVAVISSRAKYDGELVMSIPANVPGAGWLVRAWCAVGNWLRRAAGKEA